MKVKFDGYPFGDEVLEEVYFQAEIQGSIVKNVAIDPNSNNEYWEDLNKDKWLKKAKKYLENLLREEGDINHLLDEGFIVPV
jgi:hypothetical protein